MAENKIVANFGSGRGNKLEIVFKVQDPKPKCVVHFDTFKVEGEKAYKGEFGFDWMRKDWLKEESTCVEGLEKLKETYTPFELVDLRNQEGKSYGDYYAPWLTMFPNHKEKIGKEVKLFVTVPFDYLANDVPVDEKVIFTSPNNNLKIEPDSLLVDDLINGVLIEILCTGPLTADTFIEAKSFTDNALVGKLNVLKNSNHEDLTINIPIVKAYISDDDSFGEGAIDAELNKVKNLEAIEKYLNTKSLNQALIQVKFQYKEGKPYDLPFSKRSLRKANEGKNPKNDQEDYDYLEFKGMITNNSIMEFDSGRSLNFFHHQFKLLGRNIIKEKNIILYLTSLKAEESGGSSFISPLDNKHCIIFKSNLSKLSSYAHEIAHTLGLEHTFPEEEDVINTYTRDIDYVKNYIETNSPIYGNDHVAIKYMKRRLKSQQERKDDYQVILNRDQYKFDKRKTKNIMDYSSKREYFYKYQIKIMQDEATKYYH